MYGCTISAISDIPMNTSHKPNCAECQNLESGGWCKALLRSVSGSRHIRKCDSFVFDRPNPKPVRKGRKAHPGLVQCVSCEYFIPWGKCGFDIFSFWFDYQPRLHIPYVSHSYLGRLEPRIWRRCKDYVFLEKSGCCNDCLYLAKDYCNIAEYPVTGKYKEISCQFFKEK